MTTRQSIRLVIPDDCPMSVRISNCILRNSHKLQLSDNLTPLELAKILDATPDHKFKEWNNMGAFSVSHLREKLSDFLSAFAPKKSTALDYAREILETGLRLLKEVDTDPRYYAEVAPAVNGAMANFLAAEAAEREDPSK